MHITSIDEEKYLNTELTESRSRKTTEVVYLLVGACREVLRKITSELRAEEV
jgi:hypothetical protein